MRLPLIVGYSEGFQRNGESFAARCSQCGREAKMFCGKTKESVSAFFVSLWDGGVDAVQCGECLAVFELPDDEKEKAKPKPARAPSKPPPPRPAISEKAIDDELALLKKKLGK